MAIRYAVASGNFSNPAIWDNGAVPLLNDDIYVNGFIIVVDQNVTANIMSNGVPAIAVPDIATPAMTSNITPSGIVFSGGFSALRDPYFAFAQDSNFGTFWQSNTNGSGILGYQYPTSKIIKRYAFKTTTSLNQSPQNWTFEGSNDGVTYTTLDTVTGALIAGNSIYTSSLLANTTAYLYYRINITLNRVPSQAVAISEFEMTESTGTVLGVNSGGTFQHTSGGFVMSANTLGVGASNLMLYTHLSGTNTLNVATNVVCNLLGGITITSGNVNISIPQITVTTVTVAGGLIKNGAGTLNFIGNITNGPTVSANNTLQLNAGIVNITGDVNVVGTSGNPSIAIIVAGATLTVTGNVTGGAGTGTTHAISIPSGNLSVIGNITGGNGTQGLGVSSGTVGSITVTGTITAGTNVVGLSSNNGSATVQLSGPLVNVNGFSAIYAPKYFITGASTTITAQSSAGVNNIFYNNTSILDALSASNVRNGISFGLGGALTGTLKVPLPSQVLIGVETDNTVGTWALIPQDFWNYATSNITDADTIGARLKNASTVDTTGAQLTAFL